MNTQKRFRDFFRFRGDIRWQRSKILCLCSQRLRGHPNFSLDTAFFKFLNYCYWMCEHTQIPFFCLTNPLKSVRSLQSFQKVSAQSLMCPRSRWLCGHTFFVNILISGEYIVASPGGQERKWLWVRSRESWRAGDHHHAKAKLWRTMRVWVLRSRS